MAVLTSTRFDALPVEVLEDPLRSLVSFDVEGPVAYIKNLSGLHPLYVTGEAGPKTWVDGQFPIAPGETLEIQIDGSQTIYVISDEPLGVFVSGRILFYTVPPA